MLAALSLQGRFYYLDQALHYSRQHPLQSVKKLKSEQARQAWFDTRKTGRLKNTFEEAYGELKDILKRTSLSCFKKLRAYGILFWFKVRHKNIL